MTGRFAGKHIMITGAGGAIARGIIQKFAIEGASLILVDRAEEPLLAAIRDCVDALAFASGDPVPVVADLNDPESVDSAVQQAEAKFGKIDILVHTAGGFAAGKPVHETEVAVFDQQIMLNARILYITLGRVAKHMVDHNVPGSIVAILARPALKGSKNAAAYSASKAAAQRIIESMAIELKDHNIRVNGVMPSTADTPANRAAMPNAKYENWVTPDQLAEAIAFLASDAASAISGESLGVYNRA